MKITVELTREEARDARVWLEQLASASERLRDVHSARPGTDALPGYILKTIDRAVGLRLGDDWRELRPNFAELVLGAAQRGWIALPAGRDVASLIARTLELFEIEPPSEEWLSEALKRA